MSFGVSSGFRADLAIDWTSERRRSHQRHNVCGRVPQGARASLTRQLFPQVGTALLLGKGSTEME